MKKPESIKSSLIICTKDRPDALRNCLGSLGKIDDLPDEILVVDSSVETATRDVVLECRQDGMRRLKWIGAVPGLTRQRNIGVAASSLDTKVIHFIDDDTIVRGGYFTELSRNLLSRADIVGCGGRILNLPSKRNVFLPGKSADKEGRVTRSGINHMSRTITTGEPRPVEWLSGCSMSFRRTLFDLILFDERRKGNGVGEDVDFCLRALQHGTLLWCPRAGIEHLQSPVNRYSAKRAGFETMNHRITLAADGLHGVRRAQVTLRGIGEGVGRMLRSLVFMSREEFNYGLGILERTLNRSND